MTKKKNTIFELFMTFLKIGAFTFGGGYAMIPFIQKEIVDRRHWLENDDVLDIVAIAESTPGPIAINAATFVGYRVAKTAGAIAATVGVVLPSFIIIMLLSSVLKLYESSRTVIYAFWGIRAGVLALIIKALITMFGQVRHATYEYLIMLAAFMAVTFLNADVILVLLLCAVSGVIYVMLQGRKKAET